MNFKNLAIEELNRRLAACRADITKLRRIGALDCREMRINEENVFEINNELRRRQGLVGPHNSTFKIGDLIVFNAAGMRKKSLGLVVGLRGFANEPTAIQVQWTVIPKFKPSVHNYHYSDGGWGQVDHSVPVWYRDGHWFETFK